MAVTPQTVREQIAWSYANLARAHAAVSDGANKYSTVHHVIRSKLYKRLLSGEMAMRSTFDDERLKMTLPQLCSYCASPDHLAIDHLIARKKGGPDHADNLILACRKCNSSKRDRDLLEWLTDQDKFPSLLLLRRYLKLAYRHCEAHELLDLSLTETELETLPFRILALPLQFPPLDGLVLWVEA